MVVEYLSVIYNILKKNILIKWFIKLTKWGKVLTCLIPLLVLLLILNNNNKLEGFKQSKKFIEKNNDELYDKFYANIYNQLVNDDNKNEYEINELTRVCKINKNSNILDIGSGIGHHVNILNNKRVNVMGIDKSSDMVYTANKTYPKCKFKVGNVLDTIQFQPNTFTHILCLYFTIYYIKDKRTFFKNNFDWLRPGGMLVIHLVNRDKFDPIVNAGNPLNMVSPQKYAKSRILNSVVKFDDFKYKSKFDLDKETNTASFKETFLDDNSNNVRQNNHLLYMDKQQDILNMAKAMGFIIMGKIDMTACQYEYQYLYILQKPK